MISVLFYVCVLILKEFNLFSFVTSFLELLYCFLIALCFVFVFEPLIEKIPVKNRTIRCTFVYLILFLFVLIAAGLLVPVIVKEWDKLKELLQMVFTMRTKESELAFSYGDALNSTLEMISRFTDLIFAYLLAFFISLEYEDICLFLMHSAALKRFFEIYDEFKEHVFLYLKALMIDVCVLFFAQLTVLNLFQVNYALSLALGLALLNIIPYFGSLFGQLLIFLVDYLTAGQFRFFLVLSVFAVQQIEANALQPVLFSRMMNIRPLYLFFSILFFGNVLGFAGVLFAPVFAVAIQFAIQRFSKCEKTLD